MGSTGTDYLFLLFNGRLRCFSLLTGQTVVKNGPKKPDPRAKKVPVEEEEEDDEDEEEKEEGGLSSFTVGHKPHSLLAFLCFFSLAEKKLIHNAKKQKTSSLSYFPHLHLIHDTCAKQKNSS